MLFCPHCSSQSKNLSDLLHHIKSIHSSDPSVVFQCNLEGCRRSFKKFGTFQKHIYTFHSLSITDSAQRSDSNGEDDTQGELSGNVSDDAGPSLSTTSCATGVPAPSIEPEKQLKKIVALSILKSREVHQIPMSVMDDIVADTQSVISFALNAIRERVQADLSAAGVPPDVIQSSTQHLQESAPLANCYHGLTTQYLQHSFIENDLGMVIPKKISLGTQRRPQGIGIKRRLVEKDDWMVYIPLLETLSVMLNKPSILLEIAHEHKSLDSQVLKDYCDGKEYMNHPLFKDHPNGLQVQLYYDDLELCNPLGSSRTKHKVGMFYFTLGNLRPQFRSKLKFINLLAICRNVYIKRYGIQAVMDHFVKDIKKLEGGHQFVVNGVSQTFYGTVTVVSGDNLGSNAMGGFKEGGSAYRHCRHCLGTADETKRMFDEDEFTLRTKEDHLAMVTEVENDDEMSTEHGINVRSRLLDLDYFDMCSGAILPDIMHDVLEGALQYELKLLLQYCIREKKYFQLSMLNDAIQNTELGYMEKDRPAPIQHRTLASPDNSLKQKAAQSWLLSRLIPFMVGVNVPEDDPYWQNYLLMLEITDILFAPEICVDDIGYLKIIISEHHSTFQTLYPHSSVIPKMHYLIHTPRLIAQFGPLVRHWTMRYEAKHSYFKRLIHNLGNFKNVSWSLAKRHQYLACYHMQASEFLNHDDLEVGPGSPVADTSRPQELRTPGISCFRARWLKVCGVEFKKPCALLVEVVNEAPVFGIVNDLFIVDNRPVAHITLYETLSFSKHFHCFYVCLTCVSKVVHLRSTTLAYHVRTFNHIPQYLIIPKFRIFGVFI